MISVVILMKELKMFKADLENKFSHAFNKIYDTREYTNKLANNDEYWENIRASLNYTSRDLKIKYDNDLNNIRKNIKII